MVQRLHAFPKGQHPGIAYHVEERRGQFVGALDDDHVILKVTETRQVRENRSGLGCDCIGLDRRAGCRKRVDLEEMARP